MLGLFNKDKIILEKIGAQHLDAVSQIHKASFDYGWEDGAIATLLKSSGMDGLVALDPISKNTISFIVFRKIAKEAEVITIASGRKWRKHGAARILMEEFIRTCLADRLSEVFLEVEEQNDVAVKLYLSLGFKQVGKREGYYEKAKPSDRSQIQRHSKKDALIMRLDLND